MKGIISCRYLLGKKQQNETVCVYVSAHKRTYVWHVSMYVCMKVLVEAQDLILTSLQ